MLKFIYKNHRGEVAERRVIPLYLDYLEEGNPDYGYAPGWFLTCEDYTGDRDGVIRSFALANIQRASVTHLLAKVTRLRLR